jgi:hypothetical protein
MYLSHLMIECCGEKNSYGFEKNNGLDIVSTSASMQTANVMIIQLNCVSELATFAKLTRLKCSLQVHTQTVVLITG